MNRKAKGTKNEYKSIRLLEALGYDCTRSAGSFGAWDIVALSRTDVVCIQVKTNSWPGTAEEETMRSTPVPPNARRLIHRWRDRQTLPDVKEL